jgi:hypothetical protein
VVVPELSWDTFHDLVMSATSGGWGGFASLAVAVIVAAGLVARSLLRTDAVVAAANEDERIERQTANAAENVVAEKAQAAAENEIEQMLKEK